MKKFSKAFINLLKSNVLLFILLVFDAGTAVSAQNLLSNGDFESGGSGTGFQIQSPYVIVPSPGSSVPGDYYITSDPWNMNNAFFIHGTDHSGAGKMLVVDGITSGGQQRFWKAGNTGGGVKIGWNGTYKNIAQPVGVYVYVLKANLKTGIPVTLKGSITLIR